MISGEFNFVEELASRREAVIDAVTAHGGIDFAVLPEEPDNGNRGNAVDFFSLTGLTALDVPLGLKRYREASKAGYYADEKGFTLDIATMALIGRSSVKYAERLPLVHFELVDEEEKPFGILTEDYTQHGNLHYDGSTWLAALPSMFSHPEVVDRDHLDQVIGTFRPLQGGTVAQEARRVMDVSPLYDTDLIFDPDSETGYVDWFVEDLDLQTVAARIDDCRIRVAEITG